MWAMNSPAESTPTVDIRDKANNNTICAESLLSKLIEVPLSNSAQHSNTSSLESLESPPLDENRAISTSCSENSFEMSSTISRPNTNTNTSSDCCALSSDISPTTTVPQRVTSGLKPNGHGLQMHELQEVIDQMQSTSESTSVCDDQQQIEVSNDCSSKYDTTSYDEMFAPWQRMPSTSKSMGAFPTFDSRERVRQSIESELDKLDTCLPNLDFDKLEQQLKCAEQERQTTERKLLGEQVRRRLALQVDQLTAGPSPRVYTRPSRSNLGYRLQTAMNLQVCYMNDLDDDDDDDDEDDLFDSSEDDFYVPKSKSAPNLHGHIADGSSMKATELRQRAAPSDYYEERIVFEEETKQLLAKAKETAKMQMELEKLNSAPLRSRIPRKMTRIQLSKMTCKDLERILCELNKRIDEENDELMRLLVDRDSLHMEQDSMLVDIEDMIQHESNSESLNLPSFLKIDLAQSSKVRLQKN